VSAFDPVRIGILGAARIAPTAVLRPAREEVFARVVAVAARDGARAARFAHEQAIATVHLGYEALLADPRVEAIYNPLPNALHARWTLAALAAGKHVLCEKPFASNAAEGRTVAEAAGRSGRVVAEAFHYRYHPLAARVREIVQSGELGALCRVEAAVCFPLPFYSDIRYQYALGGGATMDAGCYAVHLARLVGGEPKVSSARAWLAKPAVDRAMRAELEFASGATGQINCSMWSARLLAMSLQVVGERGELRVFNPLAPHVFHRMTVRAAGKKRVERFPRRSTYAYQLEAFCRAIREGTPVLTPPEDSVANLEVIDQIYRAAGLPLRGEA
jgi:predicted dehydrogenase